MMIKVDINSLIKGDENELDFSRNVNEISGGVKLNGPLFISGKILKTDCGVLVKANLKGEEIVVCDRCAEEFKKKISQSFSQEYVVLDNCEDSEYEEKAGYLVNKKNEVDLEEVVMEEISLKDEARKLCGTECKGACPNCGKNLNKDKCSCYTKKQAKNPFAKLKNLKFK